MPLPPENTLEDVKLKIRDTYSNPSVGKIFQVVLKEGPRVFKIATLLEIKDNNTKQFHHYSLKIDSINKRKAGWFAEPEKSIRLDGGTHNEIEILYKFLKVLFEGNISTKTGELHIIDSEQYVHLEKLLETLPNIASTDKLELVKTILSQLDSSVSDIGHFIDVFQKSDKSIISHIAVASRIVQYKKAYDKLVEIINTQNVSEPVIQKHLEENPWCFGSEYSKLLDRRTWARDDNLDFMLRRTVDNFLEIIEIKTPFKEPLLNYDLSHKSFYSSSKLSQVIGQVMQYIEEIERQRDSIMSKDGYDTLKIRARIIIGRDGNKEHQMALRNYNAHLHRIEIITFDQLLRIAKRVLDVFECETDEKGKEIPAEDFGDIPF